MVSTIRLDHLPPDVLREIQSFSVNPRILLVGKIFNVVKEEIYKYLFSVYQAEYTLSPFLANQGTFQDKVKMTIAHIFQFAQIQEQERVFKVSELKEIIQKKNCLLMIPRIFAAAQAQNLQLSSYVEGTSIKKWFNKNEKKLRKITELDLSNSLMLYSIPSQIKYFSGLRVLNLSKNHLKKIPNIIKNLVNLEVLNISDNKICKISKELRQMKNLIELYLDKNQITEMSGIKAFKHLEILSLKDNALTTFSFSLKKLNKLRFLHLTRNPLSEETRLLIQGNLAHLEIVFE